MGKESCDYRGQEYEKDLMQTLGNGCPACPNCAREEKKEKEKKSNER